MKNDPLYQKYSTQTTSNWTEADSLRQFDHIRIHIFSQRYLAVIELDLSNGNLQNILVGTRKIFRLAYVGVALLELRGWLSALTCFRSPRASLHPAQKRWSSHTVETHRSPVDSTWGLPGLQTRTVPRLFRPPRESHCPMGMFRQLRTLLGDSLLPGPAQGSREAHVPGHLLHQGLPTAPPVSPDGFRLHFRLPPDSSDCMMTPQTAC